MSTQCLLVGDVPLAVAREVEQTGSTVKRAALEDKARADGLYMVVHVPDDPQVEQIKCLESWLKMADDENLRVGLTSSDGVTQHVLRLLMLHHSPYALQLLNEKEAAVPTAIAQFLKEDVYLERPKDDDIELGRFFTWKPTRAQYEAQRQLTLKGSSKKMADFLEGLRNAVLAMNAVSFPDHDRRVSLPPWNPRGPLKVTENNPKLPTGTPSLADFFFLHAQADAHAKLHLCGSSDWSVPKLLVQGASGSGKTLVARLVADLIAYSQESKNMPFETVNCAALKADNLTHELFGAAPRVWSSITTPVVGTLAQAAYGVAFLDEIGDLDLSAQRGMLVFLQDGMIRPFGIEPFPGFVRIVAATNRDVPLLIERQQFRNDFSARFEFKIEIPALADRDREELERLIDFVALDPAHNHGTDEAPGVNRISRNALDKLLEHQYLDENFREMERIVHGAVAAARTRRSNCIRTKDVAKAMGDAPPKHVQDSDAYVIDITTAPKGTMLDVKTAGDIARAAAFTRSPILRYDDGQQVTQYVVSREHVLRHQQDKPSTGVAAEN